VLRRDLSGYRDSAAGCHVLGHTPLSMQATRSVGAVTLEGGVASAWRGPAGEERGAGQTGPGKGRPHTFKLGSVRRWVI
jgi:hypothetical protein